MMRTRNLAGNMIMKKAALFSTFGSASINADLLLKFPSSECISASNAVSLSFDLILL